MPDCEELDEAIRPQLGGGSLMRGGVVIIQSPSPMAQLKDDKKVRARFRVAPP